MTKSTTFIVADLCCATEENTIRSKLSSLKGIDELRFNVVSKKLEVRHSCDTKEILAGLNSVGLPGTVASGNREPATNKTLRGLIASTIAAASSFVVGLLLSALDQPEIITISLFLVSILLSGWRPAFRAFKSVRNLSLDMNFLMVIAVLGALTLGEYAEGAAVIVLFAVSLLLEALSTERSRRAIESLMDLSPSTALVKLEDREVLVPVEEVPVDAVIIIRPGERVPLDGLVLGGGSTIDQSAITGESLPVAKSPGDSVFAGSFNQRGALEIRVTKTSEDSTLTRIIRLVEEAQARKAPAQTFIERFARVYTPAVFVLALALAVIPPFFFGASFDDWFYRALVLLVIACPCALVISTPVSVINAITSAARNGVLIKGGRHLEQLADIRAIGFDKTGTVTTGTVVISDVICVDSLSESEVVRIAAAIEAKSEHHLAQAFLRKAEMNGTDIRPTEVRNFQSLPGRGIQALVGGKQFTIGNHLLVEELGLCNPELERILGSLESEGKTAVVLLNDHGPIGVMGISDQVRIESREAVNQLRQLGIAHVALLTGDNRATAAQIGRTLGADEVHAELLPEQKLAVVHSLKQRYGRTAMVGDGVNDAPALAAADVGFAMGGIGSDTALETADVVLMSDNLLHLPATIRLGKRALAIIKQNIAIALATKALFLGLGVMGLTSLWLAILADDGATLVVVLNSLRLLAWGRTESKE
ncbi:MAG: heavy metal translocating P-type ATPase [Bacteroidota bacterium]